jgi:hypothetical protein
MIYSEKIHNFILIKKNIYNISNSLMISWGMKLGKEEKSGKILIEIWKKMILYFK